ncbi:methionine--tRNA ligase [Gorillibacterium sp. CAU 1737]|uniref:methionine--tRNA ligase n=1 Tax=Gorillibacterium sp. CAU 1737 TaxID=3140362 RepID=UPI003260E82E
MSIFIGGAWPYANGSLHLGHLSSLLPGDILARYYRLKGEPVLYVSGSDCHGTPIAIRAEKEGVTPEAIADAYHREFEDCFTRLGFSYDRYTRTDSSHHRRHVQELFLRLLESGSLELREVEQTYCAACEKFLPDRYVEGLCPKCGAHARGDQCEACQTVLDPIDLLERRCKLCGSEPTSRQTEHYYLLLSRYQEELERYAQNASGWRDNAVHLTRRYLDEGLQDRAATRDLPWGVDVPLPGFEGKKIYVWIEAVSGYWTASQLWAEETGQDAAPFWSDDALAYYIHGKDNIPFHTVILPALLLGAGGLHLPDRIVSGEYLTLEGQKISTSRGWAVWVPDVLERYDPDSLRYFLTANSPEKHDGDFSWNEFIRSHNGELVNAFGNFVHRSLVFLQKSFDARVPEGTLDETVRLELEALYERTGELIEQAELKKALDEGFRFVRSANKYFDTRKPWVAVKKEPAHAADTLYTCVQIAANLARLLSPFLPFACTRLEGMLGTPFHLLDDQAAGAGITEPGQVLSCRWLFTEVPAGTSLGTIQPLFARIDIAQVDVETERLRNALT